MSDVTASEWDKYIADYPHAHILQTSAWGALKSTFGWQPRWLITVDAGAQVLFRRLPFGLSVAYIPKGPIGDQWESLLPEVDQLCRTNRSIFLKVEPDLWQSGESFGLPPDGFQASPHSIQPPRTILMDIQGDESAILGRMKQKTRYNIRLALKKGIVVKPFADIELFYQLMYLTGKRDQFGVHSREYYQRTYELFHSKGACEMLLAEFEGQPISALMVFAHGRRAWYFYGASVDQHRERMPNYLLQWEAIRWARKQGCTEYDLWGVPDEDEETLEANFTQRAEGLWGVYRFKRGFGGRVMRAAGPWDRVYKPVMYIFYTWLLKRDIT